MATLLDELAADFLDDGDDFEGSENEQENGDENGANGHVDGDAAMADEEAEARDKDDESLNQEDRVNKAIDEAEDDEEAKERIEKIDLRGVSDFKTLASLMKSLRPILEQIDHYLSLPQEQQEKNRLGNMEDSPEYKLMNEANSLSTQIDTEITVLHKWVRDHYSAFFAGLERLVENPIMYAKTVAIIGNGPMDKLREITASSDNIVGQPLDRILDKALLMSVRMEASTGTSGTPLPEAELKMVLKACETIISLDKAKDKIKDYVQSRMTFFAPNLTVLIGAETAALLVNTAGGISKLANIPSCNLANIGWKTTKTGFATNVGIRQKGVLYHSPIIKQVPMDDRKQALRIIAAKITLAARTDSTMKKHDDTTGRQLREQVAKRLDALTNAAPQAATRALKAPDDKPSRKRGGRRARAEKAKYAVTDLQKQQNRMAFGKEEQEMGYGTGDSTKGMGMIGAQNSGQIRQTGIDKRTAAKLSKKNQALWGSSGGGGGGLASSLKGFGQGAGTTTGLRTSGVGTGINAGPAAGTSSVIAFTPFQGLELVDPRNRDEAERKRKADEDRYFKSGTFTNVGGGTASMVPSESKVDAGGFKVPALPALKRVKKEG